MPDEREWVSVKEAQERTGCPLNTIYSLTRRGQIKSRKSGKSRQVDLHSVKTYWDKKTQESKGETAEAPEKSSMQEQVKGPLERENEEFRQQFTEAKETISRFGKSLDDMKRKNEEFRQQFAQTEKFSAEFRHTGEQLRQESLEMRSRTASLEEDRSRLEKEQERLRLELQSKLEVSQMGEWEKKFEEMRSRTASVEEACHRMEKECERLQLEVQGKYQEWRSQMGDLEKRFEQTREHLMGELQSVKNMAMPKAEEHGHEKPSMEELQETLEGYKREIENLQQKYRYAWKAAIIVAIVVLVLAILFSQLPLTYGSL